MPITITIEEEKLEGFSQGGREELESSVERYADELIREANRIEAGGNPTDGDPEVTQGIVREASVERQRLAYTDKTDWRILLARVFNSFLWLLAGVLFDTTKFQSVFYAVPYMTVILLAGVLLVLTEVWRRK